MGLPWFRMYAEFAGDPVVQSLAFEDQRHFIILLCLKCNGTLDRDIPSRQREVIIVRGLGLDPVTAAEVKRRLIEVDLIDKSWQPMGWDKRQFSSDHSTVRVRKYRKNKDTGNVSETLHDRFGNGPDTDTDTDTEEETNTRSATADTVCLIFEHWQITLDHPRAILTPERRAKIARALKHYTPADLLKAIDGCAVTPHNMGYNDRGEKYDDIELILRDAKHVERFMRNADNPPVAKDTRPSEMQRAADALRNANESAQGHSAKPAQVPGPEARPGAAITGPAVHGCGDGGGPADARPDGRRRTAGR